MSKFNFFSQNLLIQARGRLLDLSRPVVMAIINLSRDSFYAASIPGSEKDLIQRVEKLILEGAKILDLGAASSRPGAQDIPAEEEWQLLRPALRVLRERFPELWISVDTFRASVARNAALEDCDIINDISGGLRDPMMLAEVAASGLPYIIMHMRGDSRTMSSENQYTNMVLEIMQFFNERIAAARAAGVGDIILDPGFGFSKVHLQNFELLAGLHNLRLCGYPLLAGLSRKSLIQKLLGTTAEGSLNGTTATNMLALVEGASILRVHDVREAVETIKVFEAYQGAEA